MFKHDRLDSPDVDSSSFEAVNIATSTIQTPGGASMIASVRGAPRLTGANPPDDLSGASPNSVTVSLYFNEAIQRGSGFIYVTDGVAQTVIGRDGKPAMRIVGATDTRAIAVSDISKVTIINGTALVQVGDLREDTHYSVLMAKGVFTDLDGIAHAGLTSSTDLNFTTSAAPPSATVHIDDSLLGVGDSATVTVTFTRPIANLNAENLLVSSGTLGSFSANADRTVWTATFTPALGAQDASNLITLPGSAFQDDAGRSGVGSFSSDNYIVDLHHPLMTSMAHRVGHGAGADLVLTFSEAVYWEDASTLTVSGEGYSAIISPNQVSWSLDHKTLTIAAAVLGFSANQSYTLTLPASLGDQAGNAPTRTSVTIDTTPSSVSTPSKPSLSLASDTGALSYDSRTTDDTPSFHISGLIPGGKVRVYDNGELAGEFDVPSGTLGVETWTASPLGLGTHVFTVSNVDSSGKESQASAVQKIEIADVLIDIDLGRQHLESGATNEVHFTFAKEVPNLDASAFLLSNATLSNFSGSGTSWTAILAPTPGVFSTSNHIELIPENLVFGDGSHPASMGQVSLSYSVDTIVTAYVSPGIDTIDNGISGSDDLTSASMQTLSGSYAGELQAGDIIELDVNGNKHTAMVDAESHTWTWTGNVGSGGIEIGAKVVRGFHSSAATGRSFTVDSTAPVAEYGTTYSGVGQSEDFLLSFGEDALYWNDDSTLSFQGNGKTLTFTRAQLGFSDGDNALDLPAALHQMISGRSYTLTLPTGLTDAAGNRPATTYTLTTEGALDTVAPVATAAAVNQGAGYYGIGDSLQITVHFDEDVWVVGTPSLSLAVGNTGTAVYQSGDGSAYLRFLYTVGTGDVASELTLSAVDLAGKVRDAAGNLLTAGDVQFDALTAEGSGAPGIAIGGVVPVAPSTPVLAAGSDSGVLNDRITSDTTPVFSGSGAQDGAVIALYNGSVKIGSILAANDGSWSVEPDEALAHGSYTLTVTQEDIYGNVSSNSSSITVAIDTAAPTAAPASSGNGSALTIEFSETIRFTSGTIEVRDGDGTLARSIVTGDTTLYTVSGSTLTLSSAGLADGTYTVKLSDDAIADAAGNFTVDLVGANPGESWLVGVTV